MVAIPVGLHNIERHLRTHLLDHHGAVDRHAQQHDALVGADLGEPGEVDDALLLAGEVVGRLAQDAAPALAANVAGGLVGDYLGPPDALGSRLPGRFGPCSRRRRKRHPSTFRRRSWRPRRARIRLDKSPARFGRN